MKIELELKKPDEVYKDSFIAALDEIKNKGEKSTWIYLGSEAPLDTPKRNFTKYVQRLLSQEIKAEPQFVKNSTYWAIHKGEVIGRISLRHELNDFLKTIGGHIGYIVRPTFREQGVATEMLRLLLLTEKAQEIKSLLLTCDDNNLASERTIVKNGGVLEAVVEEAPRSRKKRFWITL